MRKIFAAVDKDNYQKLKPMVERFVEIVDTNSDWIHHKLPKDVKIDWQKLYKEEGELNFRIYATAELFKLRTETLYGNSGEEPAFQDLRTTLRLLNPEGAKTLRPYQAPLFSAQEVQLYYLAYQQFLVPIDLETAIPKYTELFRDGYSEEMGDPYQIYMRAHKKYLDVLSFCFQNHYAFLEMSDGTP